jgi:HEAT repeat protein
MHALALVCLGLVWAGDGEEESSLDRKPLPRLYSGRTLDDWIITANNPSEEVRAEAMALFGDIGPAARAALPTVQQGLKDQSGLVRVTAAYTLWRIDRYDPQSFSVLTEALKAKDEKTRQQAAETLVKFGKYARPALDSLIAALGDKEEKVRLAAAAALGDIGAQAKEQAGPALEKLLKDPEPSVRVTASWAYWSVCGKIDKAMPVAVAGLSHKEDTIRGISLLALGKMGPAAGSAAAEVAKLITDTNEQLRHGVVLTLGQLGTGGQAGLAALAKVLQEGRQDARSEAFGILPKIDPKGKKVMPLLAFALTERNTDNRLFALLAMRDLGESARSALPALRDALKDDATPVRGGAAAALGKVSAAGEKETIEALRKVLTDRDHRVRLEAGRSLMLLTKKPDDALTTIKNALKEGDTEERRLAMDILDDVKFDMAQAGPLLVMALADRDEVVRGKAAQRLVQDATPYPEAAERLRKALKDESETVRFLAAAALFKLDTKRKDLVSVLCQGLLHGNDDCRKYTAQSLGCAGEKASAAVPFLIQRLSDEKESVRSYVCVALASIGPPAKKAVSTLEAARKDEDEEIRKKAAEAIQKIGVK